MKIKSLIIITSSTLLFSACGEKPIIEEKGSIVHVQQYNIPNMHSEYKNVIYTIDLPDNIRCIGFSVGSSISCVVLPKNQAKTNKET